MFFTACYFLILFFFFKSMNQFLFERNYKKSQVKETRESWHSLADDEPKVRTRVPPGRHYGWRGQRAALGSGSLKKSSSR
jgi:hypothetical protein